VSALLDTREIARVLDRHVSGDEPNGHALWAVWLLERWLRKQVLTGADQVLTGANPVLTGTNSC
jgi:hypothetical protein